MKVMRVGGHGPEVRELQIQLKRFEPGLVDDGKYGWRTERAVRFGAAKAGRFPA